MAPPARRRLRLLASLLPVLLAACDRDIPVPAPAAPSTSERMLVTVGEFQAGPPAQLTALRNPYENDATGLAQGRQLYTWFNCDGCHGAAGGGGIGPPLRDDKWIYGSDPASIFQTIAQGRPNGMPAFGGKIPDDAIWRIELFVSSLGGVSTTVRAGGSSGVSPTGSTQAGEDR